MAQPKRRLELFATFPLRALHSLEEREAAHEHLWKIDVGLTGPLEGGRLVSLPALTEALAPVIDGLQGSFLNENPKLDADSRRYPTCESMALYFEREFQQRLLQQGWTQLVLTEIRVSVFELDGQETGSVRLTLG